MLKKIFYLLVILAMAWSIFVSSCARHGKVVDAETNQPVGNVQVIVRYSKGHAFRLPMEESDTWGGCFATRISKTDESGYYEIPAALPWYKAFLYLLHPRKYAAYSVSFYKEGYYTSVIRSRTNRALGVGSGNRYGLSAPTYRMRKDVLSAMHKLEYLSSIIYRPLDYCRGRTPDSFKADLMEAMRAEVMGLIPQWEQLLLEQGDDALPELSFGPENITPPEFFSEVTDYKPQGKVLQKLRSLDALYDWKAAGYDKE